MNGTTVDISSDSQPVASTTGVGRQLQPVNNTEILVCTHIEVLVKLVVSECLLLWQCCEYLANAGKHAMPTVGKWHIRNPSIGSKDQFREEEGCAFVQSKYHGCG